MSIQPLVLDEEVWHVVSIPSKLFMGLMALCRLLKVFNTNIGKRALCFNSHFNIYSAILSAIHAYMYGNMERSMLQGWYNLISKHWLLNTGHLNLW